MAKNDLQATFSRANVDRDIEAELKSHIEMRIEDNVAAGMSAHEARRDALVRFGNRAATKEKVAGMDAALALDSIWSDLRFALRQLARSPGFALTAVVVLALGIGASVAMFAFVDAALVRPLPYAAPTQYSGAGCQCRLSVRPRRAALAWTVLYRGGRRQEQTFLVYTAHH